MKKNGLIATLLLIVLAGASVAFAADAPQAGAHKEGYKDTPLLPGVKWHVHDADRPQPPIVTPGAKVGQPPSDAIVLFDGKDLSKWEDTTGKPSKWKVVKGAMECVPSSGYIQTRQKFGDIQLHLEFACPTPPKGNSQGRGNSGVFLGGGKYEVQVLDSYDNVTYADGQCGAVYGQYPPQVNASRRPGEWQSYDMIFHMPKFGAAGKLLKPAFVTVFQNGVLMQDHTEILGATGHKIAPSYTPHKATGSLQFQDHGNPVRYRNIWVRELKETE